MAKRGVFVGLSTIDIAYLVDRAPHNDEKIVAREQLVAAGGPATNAAITFAHLGGEATLVSPLGRHPLVAIQEAELAAFGVRLARHDRDRAPEPAVSSIFVTRTSGERAVVSVNTSQAQAVPDDFDLSPVDDADIVLVDGHHMALCVAAGARARRCGVPVVFDGGSWKPGSEALLAHVDVAICSADFAPPGCGDEDSVFDYLISGGVTRAAITRGARPVVFRTTTEHGNVAVPAVDVVDTLGAGDIFHGGFCFHYPERGFADALAAAAHIAAHSCTHFGTRAWMSAGLQAAGLTPATAAARP